MRLAFLFFTVICFSCSQKKKEHTIDAKALELNKRSMELVSYLDNADSCKKALTILDSATAIDSNYYLGYFNKLMFYNSLKDYDGAIKAINKAIRIKPHFSDAYIIGGMFYRKIDDTVSSKKYFEKSLSLCNETLDTMKKDNRSYSFVASNKAITLKMLDRQIESDKVIDELYRSPQDTFMRKNYLVFKSMTKNDLMESMTGNNKKLPND